jgi:hypothetical protein
MATIMTEKVTITFSKLVPSESGVEHTIITEEDAELLSDFIATLSDGVTDGRIIELA